MHSDQTHETSSKFPKCDESDSHITGHLWFETHRQAIDHTFGHKTADKHKCHTADGSRQMSKWLVGQNRCFLVDNGFFPGIRDNLLQAGLLTAHEVEEIEEDNIRHKQMRRFVDKLCQKSDEAIEKCCEVIREADRILYDQLQWPCPPSHVTEVDGQKSDDLGKIQQELKSWYTEQLSHFHPIPWCDWLEMDLDHVYTNLKMVKGLKHQLSSPVVPGSDIDDTKGLLELLFSRDGRTVTFIQGPAGIGKSTLCRRLAYLWATNNCLIHGHHFDLVLLVEARSIVGDNLKQSIVKQLFPEDYDITEEAVSKCITTCGKNALLIIDGVDELTQEGKMAIQKLLKGRFFRHTNVVLTGRPESLPGLIQYASVHLEVSGFTRKNVKSYIHQYFGNRNKEFLRTLFARLHFLTNDYDSSEELSDDEVFGESGRELRELCVNPFTTCLLCLLVEEKGGDIPSDENDILEDVITLTLDRYVFRSDIHEGVTTKELLRMASEVAWIGFSHGYLCIPEGFIKEFYTGGLGEHLLKSGVMDRDFTMSRFHASGYCYFPHRSIQDFLCAKYLVTIPQTSLDEILMDLPLDVIGWWQDMVKKLVYQLKGQKERLRRSVLCILDKCPVYRKLKPGFQKYVGRLTNEERIESNNARDYANMAATILQTLDGNMALSILSASDEMLRISYNRVSNTLGGMCQNLLALPVLYCPISELLGFRRTVDDCIERDWDNYARHHYSERKICSFQGKVKIMYRCIVDHEISHVYVSNSPCQWCHFDYFENIADCFKMEYSELPSVLSVLVLPGFIETLVCKALH